MVGASNVEQPLGAVQDSIVWIVAKPLPYFEGAVVAQPLASPFT